MDIIGTLLFLGVVIFVARGGFEINYHYNVARRAKVHARETHERIQREQAV